MNTAALTCFQLTVTDHIAHLVLSRPEAMNTMGPTFWRELDQVLTRLNQSGEARVLVVSSTGRHFSAGMSLEVFGDAILLDDRKSGRVSFTLADIHSAKLVLTDRLLAATRPLDTSGVEEDEFEDEAGPDDAGALQEQED